MGNETAILEAVDKLYSSALSGDSWSPALTAISDLFGAVGTSFEVLEASSATPIKFEYAPGLPLPAQDEYLDYFSRISPRVSFNIGKPAGFVSYDHMILSEKEMDRDEFYADFIPQFDLRYFIAVQVLSSESHQAVFAAQRSRKQGHVDTREIALMHLLAPHFKNAADLHFRLSAARQATKKSADILDHLDEGCFLAAQNGDVLSVNPRAHEIFSAADGVSLKGKQLSFADKDAAQRYRQILASVGSSGEEVFNGKPWSFAARRPSEKRPYLFSLRPFRGHDGFPPHVARDAAIVFVRDTDAFCQLDTKLLAETYNLSAAEAEVAAALDAGLPLHEIAGERGVSITTVRSQLYALMSKLGVGRQTDLTRILAQYRLPFA